MTSDLRAHFAAASHACTTGESTRDYEPAFSRLLDHLQSAPDSRTEATALIIDAVRTGSLAWELIAYLMHELRWPEVMHAAREQLAVERDLRAKTVLSHILEAFTDDWSEADLYRRWSQ